MPRGQPDYGAYSPQTYIGSLSDMAELAARLGSIVIFDRRGRVVNLDDFEGAQLKWIVGFSIGSTVTFDHSYPQSGSQCVKLTPSAAVGTWVAISKEFGVVISQRLGSEISFCNPSSSLSFYVELAYWDGTDFYRGRAKLDFNTNKMYLYTGTGSWTEFMDIDAFYTSSFTYFHFKLVVDLETKKYVRVMLNGVEYDISAYALAVGAGAGAKRLQQTFSATNETGAAGSIYIDDSIFTQEEP